MKLIKILWHKHQIRRHKNTLKERGLLEWRKTILVEMIKSREIEIKYLKGENVSNSC